MEPPEAGWATSARIEKVIDGDTVMVSITRTFPLRIRNLRCPELNQAGGKEAKQALSELVITLPATIFVPAKHDLSLMDIASFQRIVGDLWLGHINVHDYMIDNGFGIEGTKEGIS
jgi:endonuclease YncB( thermonuclease family)